MYYISIDLGGTIIKIGLSQKGKVLSTAKLEALSAGGLNPRLSSIASEIDKLLAQNSVPASEIGGVLMAFPGIVDVSSGRAAGTNAKYSDAPSLNLKAWVWDHWKCPFAMDNDARCASIGEWLYGAGSGLSDMVMMTIGTGIGTGVIMDSHPIYGSNFCAGSLGGHFTINDHGRRCTCGNIGCVEAHGSSFFLPAIIAENSSVSLSFKEKYAHADFKLLFDLLRGGDSDAKVIVEECMDVWSAGIVNYIHAYGPQKVIIGGGIMKSADIILPYIRRKVEFLAWQPINKVDIEASVLEDNAALLASEYYFKKN